MANIEPPQDIPSELLAHYLEAMREADPKGFIGRRYPFRLPHMQNTGSGPSDEQRIQREFFRRAACCWRYQPHTGGAEPAGWGGYSRTWWYDQALGSGLWYYDYFMQQTIISFQDGDYPLYGLAKIEDATWVNEQYPDLSYFGSIVWWISAIGNNERWAYIKLPHMCAGTLFVTAKGWDVPSPRLWWVEFGVYAVTAPWDPATITWNNKPALGTLLAITSVNEYDLWNKIKIGATVNGVCIKRLAGDWGGRFYSQFEAVEARRPYISA